MFIHTGERTDTVQYYSDWLLNRFREGFVLVRNPICPQKVARYELTPEKVDGVLLCSKDYRPILPRLGEITARFPAYFFYTITAYGRDMEPGVPDIASSVATLRELSALVGRERLAWRYDPVLLTAKYTAERHLETFAALAAAISPYVERCIFSFVELYQKVQRNLPGLAAPAPGERDALARGMGEIAARYGLPLQTCGTDEDFSRYGIAASACMTAERFARANGISLRRVPHRGTRRGCHCMESRDIGAYDTCPNGCRYCYANRTPALARQNFRRHDPKAPLLLGRLLPGDMVTPAVQESFRSRQGSLFL